MKSLVKFERQRARFRANLEALWNDSPVRIRFDARELHTPEMKRFNRITAAGRKLAQIDWAMFREARFALSDVGTFARIPDPFVRAYVRRYEQLRRGKV